MCHAGKDGDAQGPVQTPVAAAVEPVADGVLRGRRNRVHTGQSGKHRFGTHQAVMGPCGEADGSSHGADAALLEQWRGLAGVDELAHTGAVGSDLFVKLDHVPGQTNGLGPSSCSAKVFLAGTPTGHRGDLRTSQRPAGIDTEVYDAQESNQCVDGGGAFGRRMVTELSPAQWCSAVAP